MAKYFDKVETSKNRECENEPTIVIEKHGNKTVAKLFDGIHEKPVKVGTAKCSPEDEFDFEAGAKLAFSRLMGENESESKQTADDKIKVGDTVRIINDGRAYSEVRDWFKVNCIDIDIIARYAYGGKSENFEAIGTVEAIAPHVLNKDWILYAVKIGKLVYIFDKLGIEKIKE